MLKLYSNMDLFVKNLEKNQEGGIRDTMTMTEFDEGRFIFYANELFKTLFPTTSFLVTHTNRSSHAIVVHDEKTIYDPNGAKKGSPNTTYGDNRMCTHICFVYIICRHLLGWGDGDTVLYLQQLRLFNNYPHKSAKQQAKRQILRICNLVIGASTYLQIEETIKRDRAQRKEAERKEAERKEAERKEAFERYRQDRLFAQNLANEYRRGNNAYQRADDACENTQWTCPTCTFNNSCHMSYCELCSTPRPQD